MKKNIITIIIIALYHLSYAQINKITAYHVSFSTLFYIEPTGDEIKNSDHKIYVNTRKIFTRKMSKFINSIDTCRLDSEQYGAHGVRLLLELNNINGEVKKIFFWVNGEFSYNNKVYLRNEYLINLIEKNFKKIDFYTFKK